MSRSVSAPSSVTNTSPCWYGLIVPGSTLMYGSSFRMETRRPRALRIRPTLAAVMPLPSEEVTPPVTKTYFAMGTGPPGVFPMLSKDPPAVESTLARGAPEGAYSRGGGHDPGGGSKRPSPQTSGPQKNG